MEIKYYDLCVAHAFAALGINANSFEEADLRVYKRYDFNPQAIYSAVGKGGIVMPIVRATVFGREDDALVYTVISRVNRASQLITLFNPFDGKLVDIALPQFINQWQQDGSDCVTVFRNDAQTYKPSPADLSQVALPASLAELCELMAENAHDVWATERQSEGWTYGPKRDDHHLQTPDMIPYAQLPETEKQYDRLMATETLKLLLSLGYKIEKQ